MILAYVLGVAAERVAQKLPGDKDVVRELNRLLAKDSFFKKPRPLKINLDWLESWINNAAKVLKFPLLILLGLGVAIGLYFLIRALIPYIQGKANKPHHPAEGVRESEKALPPDHFLTLYRLAVDQSLKGQYRQAMISLHKATVEYVLIRVIIVSTHKKYTNNDLKRKLAGNTLYQPFCVITNLAEIAGFSTLDIGQSHFNQAREAFENAFL